MRLALHWELATHLQEQINALHCNEDWCKLREQGKPKPPHVAMLACSLVFLNFAHRHHLTESSINEDLKFKAVRLTTEMQCKNQDKMCTFLLKSASRPCCRVGVGSGAAQPGSACQPVEKPREAAGP